MASDKVFIKITNKEIYSMLTEIKKELEQFREQNAKEHSAIIQRQDHTNGRVTLNRWIATTSLTIILSIVLFLIKTGWKL